MRVPQSTEFYTILEELKKLGTVHADLSSYIPHHLLVGGAHRDSESLDLGLSILPGSNANQIQFPEVGSKAFRPT